ncbi:MAG: aldo/keto reductase [Bacteroidota bacterium]
MPGTITIAANSPHPLIVNRLGYGTMRLTGPGIYGEPPNRPEALEILQTAVRKGVNFLDTADYYGADRETLVRKILWTTVIPRLQNQKPQNNPT